MRIEFDSTDGELAANVARVLGIDEACAHAMTLEVSGDGCATAQITLVAQPQKTKEIMSIISEYGQS